ncbi:DEAD/DEAH box helicase [uncultured Clostridium sp.]|uniref:helicase-related protein n=1 Tax=uncultured Clostridium sp. TaxID=59620 RepID=UPI0025EA5E72|nr:DEAD/DEAH box helicase [uncultured Clostridium sp.]
MGSIKCSLRKEVKNDIAKYIDTEFINEAIKEITIYIKTTHKVHIDDSEFNENDIDSKVTLNDGGKFNVYDYTYVKDFIYELSWEGSYVKELEEDNFTEEDKEVYKYIPKDIAAVIYEKVEKSMEQKKGELYKKFKKRYTEDFLFNSVRWYKRSRDGKIYYDMDLEELSPDKKIKLEEKIKAEVGNGFKSRWGSPVASKVAHLEEKLLLDIYDKGCDLLGIENEYSTEVVEADNSYNEKNLINLMIKNCREAASSTKGINRLKVKVVNSIDARLDNIINTNIYKTKEHMNLYLENARNMVFGYYKSVNLPGFKRNLIGKEDKINKIIARMAVVENILYKNYLEENENSPSIDEMEEIEECITWICIKGLVWTSENIYIRNKAKDDIKDIILDNPVNEYEEARAMKRHFILHVGETNTGKTYASIERLMEAESGVYLAPLRLLALEIQDKLNSQNIACSLLTGEEEDILNYAYHVSSTIEKLQLGTPYDVCVIDEAQMIADKQRGWAWTRAILGVLAPEIHICMAPEALDIVIKLIKDCNDTYEVIKHTRDTELVFEDEPFNLNKDVKKGDALVVFGKKKALAVSAQLLNNNIKTSIIYGSLPYSTRKKQFERFLDGETEVIVCTDAIGMGVNLPIKRIVFLETRKYDGVSLRKLNVSEIKQIAGRAGRKGIYDKGYVTAMSDRSLIKDALTAESNKIKKCYIGVPNSLLDINIDIIDALKTWSTMFVKGHYEKTDVTMIIFLLNKLKKLNIEASKEDLLKMATIPFEENNKAICALWEEYCMMYSQGAVNLKKPILKKNVSSKKELDNLENYYKSLELNYSFGKNFNMMINNRFIALEKEETANKINELLLTKLLDHERVCSICGKKLAWDCASDKCRICREMIQGIKSERYKKPVFRGGRRSSRFSRDRRNRR